MFKKKQNYKYLNNHGQSILEVIIAMAIFSLIGAAMATMAVGGFTILEQGGEQTEAQALAQEGIEAVRAIRDNAWNENIYNLSSVSTSGGRWIYNGEGTTETIGDYTRTISFADVCRDASDNITSCPGNYTDIHTKLVESIINWEVRSGVINEVKQTAYITNWDSQEWTQTNWSGGSGQILWSDITRYNIDDGNVDVATAGQVSLISLGGDGCGTKIWSFSVPARYAYDTNDIEVTGGYGQLKLSTSDSVNNINDSVIDILEFDASLGVDPRMINVSGDIYAIVYGGINADGFLVTVNVDSSGNIADSIVDSYEFGALDGEEPDIVHVTGDIYAIVYEGQRNDGFVSTITINSNGIITKTLIDTLEFETSDLDQGDIIQIDTNTYAVAYNGAGGDGFIRTFDIDSAGNISASYTDSLEFDPTDSDNPKIINVSGDIYAVVYNGPGADGWIRTVSIDLNGNIADSVIDSFEYDASNGRNPSIVHVSGNIYAVAYSGNDTDGYISTVSIDLSGNITQSVIDTLEYDTDNGDNSEIVYVSGDMYLVSYEGVDGDGFAALIEIQSNGDITNTVVDVIEFDALQGLDPFILGVGNNFFAIAYSGPTAGSGWLATIEAAYLGTYPIDEPPINPTTSYAPVEVDAWSSFTETAIKNGGEIYYQLSDDNGSTWYYWNGSNWAIAGANDYNLASVVDANISNFFTTNGQIMFKAFLKSDGTQLVQLDEVQIDCVRYYNWPFSNSENYTYDTDDIEVTAGYAQLKSEASYCAGAVTACNTYSDQPRCDGQDGCSWTAGDLGSTLNPSFDDSDASNWTYYDWDQGGGEVNVNGEWISSGGNPNGWVDINFPRGNRDELGGFWEQAFATTDDNATVLVDFDWLVDEFPNNPDTMQLYVFLDSFSGAPTVGQQVWSSGEITGTQGWTSQTNVDASSRIGAAGTYYLKIAIWLENGRRNRGPFGIGYDNVLLNWATAGLCSGTATACNIYGDQPSCEEQDGCSWGGGSYSTDEPPINPTTSYAPVEVDAWSSFTETAIKNGGEIYYQLSDDNGSTWYYWNGSNWAIAGANDYNLASVVDANISNFFTTNGQIMFKAFLKSDGTQLVQLDNVHINFNEEASGGGLATSGYLISSAYDMGDNSPVQIIEWDETIPACIPACTIRFEVSTAPDLGGSPGSWGSWYGASGIGTYFTEARGTLIPTDLNFNQWVRYRAVLTGDGSDTPILHEVRINYK